MNKEKPHGSKKLPTNDGSKVGELFPASSLEEYAEVSKDEDGDSDEDEDLIISRGEC